MRISRWVEIAHKEAASYEHVLCEFCGAETLTANPVAFCSNCESAIGTQTKTMEGSSPAIFSMLESIRTAVLRNDFENAGQIYDKLLKQRHSPQLLYAKGVMQIQHSNYIVSQIRYDGMGSIEHNLKLREKGVALFSEAKRLIARSRSESEIEAREAPSAYAFYRVFLCDLKMGDLKGASGNLKRISELDKQGTITSYAKIVLESSGSLYKEAEKTLDEIANVQTPPANAFYYAVFVAFKRGDGKGAYKILSSCSELIEEQKRNSLLEIMEN